MGVVPLLQGPGLRHCSMGPGCATTDLTVLCRSSSSGEFLEPVACIPLPLPMFSSRIAHGGCGRKARCSDGTRVYRWVRSLPWS